MTDPAEVLQEGDGSGTQRRLLHVGHSTEWLQSDAGLAAAIASCMAADVKCKVIPVGPLPSSQARQQPFSTLLDIADQKRPGLQSDAL